MTVLSPALESIARVQPMRISGTVAAVRGLTLLVDDLPLPIGSLVSVVSGSESRLRGVAGEVVGFNREHSLVMLLGQTSGISAGDKVVGEEITQTAPVGSRLLGRCINGLGRPLDGLGPIRDSVHRTISPEPVAAMRRRHITQPLHTGVRAIDLMLPLGRGQRMGVFAGPGVGKSTLLGEVARGTTADVNVIALIGERGREVKDFLAQSLGPLGLARSVVVVATGDESPLMRIRAAKVACTCAEFFRGAGLDVLLMMDSVTRFAHAQRQVGLSVGEPPATKGYTPSVFSSLGLLLERAGALEQGSPRTGAGVGPGSAPAELGGSITGIYTILVEGDDMTEPVADAVRGILDGHIILSRKLAQKSHYPAIDVLDSVSRVADEVSDKDHNAARRHVARLMAVYREVEDLVQIGAYAKGSNPEADVAIEFHRQISDLLRQGRDQVQPFEKSRAGLLRVARESTELTQRLLKGKQR